MMKILTDAQVVNCFQFCNLAVAKTVENKTDDSDNLL